MPNLNRKSHVAKSSNEKEAYKNFLSQRFKLDKTEEDPENPTKTDSSAFDREDVEQIKPQKKSLKLRVKDFFENNWVISIVGGLIVAILIGAFSVVIKQNVQEEKISSAEKRIDTVEQKADKISTDVDGVGKALDIFKAETGKDLQYIKEKITGIK